MNPKSPTSATRRRGTPVGALNTGSYGLSQILASSITSVSNACSGNRVSAGAHRTPGAAGSSRLGATQPDVVLQEHPAPGPGQRCLLRLVEAWPVRGDHHSAPEPQDAPQMSPSGRISRTVQGVQVGGEEVCAFSVGQFHEDPLRVQRVLVMLSGPGAHGVMVRAGADRVPLAVSAPTAAKDPYPEPVEHCVICRWDDLCKDRRRRDDDLSLVAGITRDQRRTLKTAGVPARRGLASLDVLPGGNAVSRPSLEGARRQARLQVASEDAGRNSASQVHLPRGALVA